MTQNVLKVIDLGVGPAGCGGVRISSSGVSLFVKLDYIVARTASSETIVFTDVFAFRFRDELHSQGFCEQAYDTVVELVDSPWQKELLAIEPKGGLLTVAGKHHFAVLFSSCGYLEVIAADAQKNY